MANLAELTQKLKEIFQIDRADLDFGIYRILNTRNQEIETYLTCNGPVEPPTSLGFALAGNFYPDFLLWLVDKTSGKQWLSLIDPKGIRELDLSNAKFNLNQQLQELAQSLNIHSPILSSFILSITKPEDLVNINEPIEYFYQRNILFMHEDNYLPKLFTMILQDQGSSI